MIKIDGDPDKKYDIPDSLNWEKFTDEQKAAVELEQRRLAEVVNSPFSNKTAKDIERFNAGIIIEETQQILQAIPLDEMPEIVRDTYAEALASVGKFGEALSAVCCSEKQAFYEAVIKAIDIDDAERCECNAEKVGDRYINPRYVEAEVWSVKHGKQMPVIRCNKCGHRNVQPLPKSIADERAMRAKVRAYTTGKSHEEARNITQQLVK